MNKKYPYYITLANKEPFALAGIWDSWSNPDTGDNVTTFSVITTQANVLLAQVHNTRQRMPAILQKEFEKRWLDKNVNEGEIRSMLKPYDAHAMQAHAVTRDISKLGLNTKNPNVLNKQHYPELSGLAAI